MKELNKIAHTLEQKIKAANIENAKDGVPPLNALEIRIMGQFGLLIQENISNKLELNRTQDIDALLKTDARTKRLFKETLAEHGYVYDELSDQIWIPPGANFEEIFEADNIKIKVLDYLSILTAKAIKAPEKNKQLIAKAIAVIGEPLVDKILKNGGQIEYFIK